MPKPRIRTLIIGVVVAACLFGNRGFWSFVRQAQERRRTQKLLGVLRADHERLSQELNRIQTDPAYTEYLIRKQLGYAKQGEVEYRLVSPEKHKDVAPE